MAQAWNIYKDGRKIDTVFFDKDCDRDYVLDSLIGHDNYDPDINIRKENFPKRSSRRTSPKICNRYGLDPGRAIVCRDDARELFTVHKEQGMSPTEADAMARYIVDNLNKKKDFDKYYKKYMK